MNKKPVMSELVRRFKEARRAHTPIISISTPDQIAVVEKLSRGTNGEAPKITWDCGAGFRWLNATGKAMLENVLGGKLGVTDPVKALSVADRFLDDTMLFFYNAQRFLDHPFTAQLIMNLRDVYKQNKRSLVLIGPAVPLPDELKNDVVELDDPYPDDDELQAICQTSYDDFESCPWKFGKDDKRRAAAALKGCSSFGAEQHFVMAAQRDGIHWDDLNASVRKTIEQTRGLSYEEGRETFDDIGGLSGLKRYAEKLFAGPERPALVVRLEEIEKATRGSEGGDLSGTSSDAMQVMLSAMEDYGWSGLIAYGGPGTGKSLSCKAMANSFGSRGLIFDINACKGSLVGESERQVREAVKVIRSIGGDSVFFVASCNDAESINTALRRRFFRGLWFFDVPSSADAKAIWQIQMQRWKIAEPDETLEEVELTGADIRNICRQAYSLQCSLAEAREFVVPLKIQDPETIAAARSLAEGRYLDASRGGTYQRSRAARSGRSVNIGEGD